MNIKLVRFLDYYFGILCCFVLSLIKPFFKNTNSDPNSILLIELSEMGSAILLIPIIEKIKKDRPNSRLSFLIFERHKESVEICGLVDQIITIDDRSILKFAFSLPKAILELRKQKFRYAIDCELFSRISSIIAFFSGAENTSGFVAPMVANLYRGNLYSHPFAYNNLIHITENYLGLWRAFEATSLPYLKEELKIKNYKIKLAQISEVKKAEAKKLIPDNAIIFNPDPGLIALRGWPIESFIELGRLLIQNHSCKIVIVGLNSAQRLAERCCQELGSNCLNFAGKTKSLEDLLAVYYCAKALVSADSGPAHLAPLANLPAVVLFGPESPLRFAPIGKNIITMNSEISCSPCLSAFNLRDSSCNNNICMKKLSVSSVYEKVCKFI